MWKVQRGFAAVLRAESRQCSPCELFKFDSCAGLAHAIACSTCTSQMPGALTERGDDGSMRPENTSTDRRSSNQSNTALIWRQSSNIAARSFSSGAVLRNSTDALPENPATGLGTPRSAADLASSLAARVHNAGEASSRGRRNAGRPTPSEAKEYMNGVAELEQSVGDPGAEKEHDKWENFVSLVQNRRRAVAPGSEAQLDTPQPPPGDDWNLSAPEGLTGDATNGPGILRGNDAVRQMTSWKEMAQWLLEYNNYDYLKPTEISRMWTQIVHLHMGSGKRGRYDERALIYPDAPLFSAGGRRFLISLTRATRRRLQISLGLRDTTDSYLFTMGFRAPDAGRMLWAMGKLRWQSMSLLRLLEQAVVLDIACEWNRPRYMTTALWGSAWAAPGVPLVDLCEAVQSQPEEFWEGLTAQNVCNAAWAMSMMRFRPRSEFAELLQRTLQDTLALNPAAVHPQNVGDMIQALAVLRLEPREGLLEQCEAWMLANTSIMLPNHIVAYLNGLGLMGRLTETQFEVFATALKDNLDATSEAEQQVFAQRVYVLKHLAQGRGARPPSPQPNASAPTADASPEGSSGPQAPDGAGDGASDKPHAPAVDRKFLDTMAAEGREVVLRMLADTGAAMTRDPDVALLVDLLASTGYAATPAPLEELRVAERAASGGEDGRSAAVTPLLPELYVRTRRVGADGAVEEALDKPRVALQVLRAEDVLSNAEEVDAASILGEATLVQRSLEEGGQPVVQVFQDRLAELPDVPAMQAALSALLHGLLPAGECAAAPVFEEPVDDEEAGAEDGEAQQEAETTTAAATAAG